MKAQEVAALVKAARDLFNQKDSVGAERLLAPLMQKLRADAPALHLMGLIKKARGASAEAERFFRAAIAHDFNEGNYYNDLAVMLLARGELDEAIRLFRAALALMPGAAMVRVNLARALMGAERFAEAELEARALIGELPGPEGWSLLAQILRMQERHEESLTAAAAALERAPNLRGLQHNYAAALERAGRASEALERYEAMAQKGVDSGEFALHYARALYGAGRAREGEGVLETALGAWPDSTALHTAFARMRLLRGEGEDCAVLMEAEIADEPENLAMRLACADALHRGRFHARALSVLEAGLAVTPDAPALYTAYGFVLDELNRSEEGLAALRRASDLSGATRTARRNMLSTLMRAGRPDEALALARALRRDEPHEQYLIAVEATALRMLGDPAYGRLCDYDAMIRIYDLEAPAGHFTREGFNAALAETLRQQHRVNAHPLDQHLRDGTQTARTLLTADDPNLKGLLSAADAAVRDYIARIPADDAHPFMQRRGARYRFSGLWSTRLIHGGAMPAHVHDHGWISSAYYVAVSPAERPQSPHAGWLTFGEPMRPIKGVTAERMIAPKAGALVLFPSYFWHGVAPFEGAERLSAAFDIIPA